MKKIYFFMILVFTVSGLLAQKPQWVNYTFTNHVTCLQRTGTYWWAGTTGGLIRYDTVSRSMMLFNRGNSELPADYINDLTVDDQGTLWVATHNGLARYEGGRQFSVFGPATGSLYSDNVLFVRNEKGKGLWVATDTALTFYNGNTWAHFFADDQGNKLEDITYIFPVAGSGVIYANSNQLKFLRHDSTFMDYNYPGPGVRGLAFDGNNNIYVASNDCAGGFYEMTSQWDFYDKSNSPLANDFVYDLRNDSKQNVYFLHNNGFTMKTANGNYWSRETGDFDSRLGDVITTAIYPDTLGALGLVGGLMPYSLHENYNGGYSSRFSFSPVVNLNTSPLDTNDVRNIAIYNGQKYIGTRGVAVWNSKNQLVAKYDSGSTVLTNFIGPMEADAFGRIWVADYSSPQLGVPGGFGVIDHGKFTEIKGDSILGYPFSGVTAIQWETTGISPDTTGKLWISYWGKQSGIAWLEGKTWHTFPADAGAPGSFEQFVNDKHGVKWFATWSGIYSYDGKTFTRYWNIAPIHRVTCVAMDKQGNLWFGAKPDEHLGWKGGLAMYDGQNWKHYTTDNSKLPSNWVTSIAVDTNGVIWVGTWHGGVLRMSSPYGGSTVLNSHNSVFDNDNIVKIAVDTAKNDVWFLNDNAGIFVYNAKGIATGILSPETRPGNTGVILQQNYPNPFTATTIISYTLPKSLGSIPVTLQVYNLLGQQVETLVRSEQSPGTYHIPFRAGNLHPGVYFYKLTVAGRSLVKKMFITK